jgi:VWFA-related protein
MQRLGWIFVVFSAMACVGRLPAQSPNGQNPQLKPRTPEQREQTYAAQRRVNLHVAVTDASGKPVTGLKPADFTVLDHGQPQKVAKFEEVNGSTAADAYVHGVVVLDGINGGSGGVNRARKELVKLLGQGHGPLAYPLQIVVATELGNNEGKSTTDPKALIKDLSELTRNVHSTDCYATQPGSGLQDSRIGAEFLGQSQSGLYRWNCLEGHLTESLNALKALAQEQENVNGRAIVIWTGPGWPLPPPFDNGQMAGGTATLGNLSDAIFSLGADLEEGQITLEAVSWGRFERARGARRTGLEGNLKGASLVEQEAALELPALAQESGGLALEKSKNLADALNTGLADGEEFYSFAFDPPSAKTPEEWRSVEVKVDRPGATVRTLTGYYAEP